MSPSLSMSRVRSGIEGKVTLVGDFLQMEFGSCAPDTAGANQMPAGSCGSTTTATKTKSDFYAAFRVCNGRSGLGSRNDVLECNDSDVQVNFLVNCNVVLLLFSAWSVALSSLSCHFLQVAETTFTGQR
jgi:hypothetical protein